jgi:uncharacterized protein YicC (UPF0701 family)
MHSHQKPTNESAAQPVRQTVRSMTGYAHRSEDTPLGRATLELRSVNSRFTDLQFRLGDELRTLEPMLREQLTKAVSRGKIECRMQLRGRDAESIHLNEALIASLARADARIRALAPDAAPMTVADYLRWQASNAHSADQATGGSDPESGSGSGSGSGTAAGDADGRGSAGDYAGERLWQALQPMIRQVVAEFVASREREGRRLAATIIGHVEEMQSVVARLEPMIPELLAGAEARLTARLEEALPQISSGIPSEETFARIRQEVALLGLRGDVTEEFNRLSIHFAEVLRALDQGGAIGKRLDFLTQELNREANTLASKASGVAVTDGAVALKLLIEQMREQVQNLE